MFIPALRGAAARYVTSLVLLSAVHVLAPQRAGPLALTQILAPHLFILALAALPLAFLPRVETPGRRALRSSLIVAGVVALLRFGPGLISLPAPPPPAGSTTIELVSWNLEYSGPTDEEIVSIIGDSRAAIVGLQELDPHDAVLVSTDRRLVTAYPHRELHPEEGPFGSGLLSAFPIIESGWLEQSNSAWARLDIGDGRTLLAVTSHPPPGRLGLPSVFDPSVRDAGIAELRAELIDALLAEGEPLVLFGDFNVTDREPAYGELADGLRDVHLEVGLGPGSTWRPPTLERLPFGVLRIDHVLVGPGVDPVSISADCTPRGSDHCLLRASVRI